MHSHGLLITLFLDLFATSLLVPFLPVHFYSVGLTRLLVGVFTSIYPCVQLFSSPAAGYCSDRYGRKQTLIISLVLCSFTYYFLASSSLVVIFGCRVAHGLLKHTQTLSKAIIIESSSDVRHKHFGVMNAAEALGFMLGPVVGAHFIEMRDGFQSLCKVTTTIFIVNAVIVFCFLAEEKKYTMNSETTTIHSVQKDTNLDCSVLWDILVLKLCLCISLSLFYSNYAFIIVSHFKMPTRMVGYTNSFQGLISVIAGLTSSKLLNINCGYDSYVMLHYCFSVLSISLLCLGLVTNFFIFVIFLIPLNITSTLLRIYTTEILLSRCTWRNRGSVIGIENTIASIVFFFSPFLFEICTTNFGAFSVPIVTCLITSLGAALSLFLTNKRQIM